jgi:hypothetical protein
MEHERVHPRWIARCDRPPRCHDRSHVRSADAIGTRGCRAYRTPAITPTTISAARTSR